MTKLLTILMTAALLTPAFAQGINNGGTATEEGRSLRLFKMMISRQLTKQNLANRGQLLHTRSSQRAFRNVTPVLARLSMDGGSGNLDRYRGFQLRNNIENNRIINRNWKQNAENRRLGFQSMGTFRLKNDVVLINARLNNQRPSKYSLSPGFRSQVFFPVKRSKFANAKPHVIPEESHVKSGLAMFVQAKSQEGMLQVPDRMANQYWNAWMVSHPVIKKVGRDYVAQAGFYGTLGDDPTVHPLVVDFRLKGKDKSWHVRGLNVASVNRVPREGVAQLMRFVPTPGGQLGVETVRSDS